MKHISNKKLVEIAKKYISPQQELQYTFYILNNKQLLTILACDEPLERDDCPILVTNDGCPI